MILNINKPLEWTSSDVVCKVKSILNIKKVGHAGTLDPLAEGVLIVLTDKDTKKQSEFMEMKKEYVFEMVLGVTSATYDMEGPLAINEGFDAMSPNEKSTLFTMEKIEEAFSKYIGKISQKVPHYSAVKYKGKALYKYARADKLENIVLPEREVEIYAIEVLDEIKEKDILIMGNLYKFPSIKVKVNCGKGTYIRSLAHDVGQDLNVGATVTSIVRTKIGAYTIEDSLSMDNIAEIKNADALSEPLPDQKG